MKYLSVEMPDVRRGQCSGHIKVNHPLVSSMQFQQHFFAAPLKTLIDGSSLSGVGSADCSSGQSELGSLPSPEYWFVLVSRKYSYQKQTQHLFVYPKFPLIPVKDLAAQVSVRAQHLPHR